MAPRREAGPATDWSALLPDVARLLLGEPNRFERGGASWRYGNKGSLAVHVDGDRAGTWHDFEAGVGGGTLALVEHVQQTDRAGAMRWLTDAGLIAPRNNAPRPGRQSPAPAPAPAPPLRPTATAARRPKGAGREPRPSRTLAAAILAVAVHADGTPARAYLAARWTWPPDGIGPDLPTDVRWCAAADVPAAAHLPAEAGGAVVFVLRRVDVACDPEPAVHLEALTADGVRLANRWRRTFGTPTDRVFEIPITAGGDVVLAEGQADALALALTLRAGCVRSVGGTAGYRATAAADMAARPVVLAPDAEHSGVAAVTRLLLPDALPGRSVRVVRAAAGDPADWLADWLTERAGIREYDGGMDRDDADPAAWHDLIRAIERGDSILIAPEADHD